VSDDAFDDLAWLCRLVAERYRVDARGRMLQGGGADPALTPRFLFGRTRHGNLWRFRADLGATTVRELARLAGREPPLRPGAPPPERIEPMRRVLARGGRAAQGTCSPVYRDAGRERGAGPLPAGELWQFV